MSTLLNLQTAFQEYLMLGHPQDITRAIVEDHLPIEKRLKIYFDAYRIRLKEVLQLDFAKTVVLLGDDLYHQAFIAYLNAYPSTHFNVRYFGKHFSQFLRDCSPFNQEPAFSEMADFEWNLMHTLDAADAEILPITALASIPEDAWAALTFRFHPSVQCARYDWDTPELWKAIDQEAPPRAAVKLMNAQHWLIWRKGLTSQYQSISLEQAQLFRDITAKLCFSECLENLTDCMPADQVPQFAIAQIQTWIQHEMISGLQY